jgi:putative sporulation protein YyaC
MELFNEKYNSENITKLKDVLKNYMNKDTVIICIGTDKCIGDCLAPMIGTILKEREYNYPIYGTLEDPVHALNLEKKLKEIKQKHPKSFVIGIDACLGDSEYVGNIQIRNRPVYPGKGVGKVLPAVGDISIVGIVDSIAYSDVFSIRSIRLDLIHKMAKSIAMAILEAKAKKGLIHNLKQVACSL